MGLIDNPFGGDDAAKNKGGIQGFAMM